MVSMMRRQQGPIAMATFARVRRDVICMFVGMLICRVLFIGTCSVGFHTLLNAPPVTNAVDAAPRNTVESKKPPASHQQVTKSASDACSKRELAQLQAHPIFAEPKALSHESRCPVSSWLDRMMEVDKKKNSASYLGITVGCNKAVDAIGTARTMSHNPVFDKYSWVEKLESLTKSHVYQICQRSKWSDLNKKNKTREEKIDYSQLSLNNNAPQQMPIEYHCFEPVPTTFEALSTSVQELGLSSHGFHVHQYVIGDVGTGTIPFPLGQGFGKESDSALKCGDPKYNVTCADIPKTSLDDFASTYPINIVDRSVDNLFIDTEGFDLFVLKGAKNVLLKTRYLEFEYHSMWPKETSLKEAINYLDGLDFVCYFQGKERLFRLTGCFLEDLYGPKAWSNVACVHRSETAWYGIMQDMFKETLANM